MKSNILENDREKEDSPQTMRELMEGVNQRDSDIEKLQKQIECKDLVIPTQREREREREREIYTHTTFFSPHHHSDYVPMV
jgi:hypothetical protein